jgi:hypothetical protein
MCYDQEKTQAPPDERASQFDREQREMREKRMAYQMSTAGCDRPLMTEAQILAELFKYHAPNEATLPKYAAINQAAKNFAEVVLQNCPSSADRSAAIRLIRDARMTANASVALNGLSL